VYDVFMIFRSKLKLVKEIIINLLGVPSQVNSILSWFKTTCEMTSLLCFKPVYFWLTSIFEYISQWICISSQQVESQLATTYHVHKYIFLLQIKCGWQTATASLRFLQPFTKKIYALNRMLLKHLINLKA